MCIPNMRDMGRYLIAFRMCYHQWILRRMSINIGNTNQFGFKIIAKVILVLRPHYTSDIESQAMQ